MSYKRISPQPVVEGGTGAATLTGVCIGNGTSAITGNAVTQHDVLIGAASNAITSVAPSGTSGVALISQGAAADPAFGTIVVAGGGTGAVTLTGVLTGNGTSAITANAVTQHGVVIGGASNAVSSTSVGATGTVLIGTTSSDPSFSATPTVTSISFGGSALSTFTDWTAWTPTLVGGTTAGTTTYSNQQGYYMRIGNQITINYFVQISAMTGTGNLTLASLPFTNNSASLNYAVGSVVLSGFTFPVGTTYVVGICAPGATTILFSASGSAVGNADVQTASGNFSVIGSLVYRV